MLLLIDGELGTCHKWGRSRPDAWELDPVFTRHGGRDNVLNFNNFFLHFEFGIMEKDVWKLPLHLGRIFRLSYLYLIEQKTPWYENKIKMINEAHMPILFYFWYHKKYFSIKHLVLIKITHTIKNLIYWGIRLLSAAKSLKQKVHKKLICQFIHLFRYKYTSQA